MTKMQSSATSLIQLHIRMRELVQACASLADLIQLCGGFSACFMLRIIVITSAGRIDTAHSTQWRHLLGLEVALGRAARRGRHEDDAQAAIVLEWDVLMAAQPATPRRTVPAK